MRLVRFGMRVAVMLGCLLPAGFASAEVVVVGHPARKAAELDAQQVKRIWLGQVKHTPDGEAAHPVDHAVASRTRDDFYLKLLDKSPNQVKAYWARITFTGKGEAPPTVADDAAVKEWLAQHPDAIGYIDAASVDARVKVLLRLK